MDYKELGLTGLGEAETDSEDKNKKEKPRVGFDQWHDD